MSILKITNLTDTPEKCIYDKYMNAFEWLESEFNVTIDEAKKKNFIDGRIDSLEEQAEETKGSDLLSLIDNYIVNNDYYTEIEEAYKSDCFK